MTYVGHVLWKGKLKHLSHAGKITGKLAKERQRHSYLKSIYKIIKTTMQLIQLACNREIWQLFTQKEVDT